MGYRIIVAVGAAVIAVTALTSAQSSWTAKTSWGDPDYQGEWTSEGEYGVPLERPAQYGTRAFLTDEEYAKRIEDVRVRNEKDLETVDVLAGPVAGANAPIPHWREYNTTSRRTSFIVDPPDGRLPKRTAQASRPPGPQRCGTLQGGEPCDSYEDYGLGVRCIVHGGGFPDAMFPAVYNANFRIVQSPGYVAITYELIHDTRVIPIYSSPQHDWAVPSAMPSYMGSARGWWEGSTLVIESGAFKATTRGASPRLRLVERFTRTSRDAIEYRVTFVDPSTWTTPWTAALDLKARHDPVGVFEYACHEGNYGLEHMLKVSRMLDKPAAR